MRLAIASRKRSAASSMVSTPSAARRSDAAEAAKPLRPQTRSTGAAIPPATIAPTREASRERSARPRSATCRARHALYRGQETIRGRAARRAVRGWRSPAMGLSAARRRRKPCRSERKKGVALDLEVDQSRANSSRQERRRLREAPVAPWSAARRGRASPAASR